MDTVPSFRSWTCHDAYEEERKSSMPATLTPGKATIRTYSSFSPPTTTRPPCHTRYYPFITLRPYHSSHHLFVQRCNRALCTATRVGFLTGERKSLIGCPFFLAVLWSANVTTLDLHIPQSFPIFCCQYRYAQHHISLCGYIGHVWSVCFYGGIFCLGRFWYGYLGCMTSPLPLSLSLSVCVCVRRTLSLYSPKCCFAEERARLYICGLFFFICFQSFFGAVFGWWDCGVR